MPETLRIEIDPGSQPPPARLDAPPRPPVGPLFNPAPTAPASQSVQPPRPAPRPTTAPEVRVPTAETPIVDVPAPEVRVPTPDAVQVATPEIVPPVMPPLALPTPEITPPTVPGLEIAAPEITPPTIPTLDVPQPDVRLPEAPGPFEVPIPQPRITPPRVPELELPAPDVVVSAPVPQPDVTVTPPTAERVAISAPEVAVPPAPKVTLPGAAFEAPPSPPAAPPPPLPAPAAVGPQPPAAPGNSLDMGQLVRQLEAEIRVSPPPAVRPDRTAEPAPARATQTATGQAPRFDPVGEARRQMQIERERQMQARQIDMARRQLDAEYRMRREREEKLAREKADLEQKRQDPLFRMRERLEQDAARKAEAEEAERLRRQIDPEYAARRTKDEQLAAEKKQLELAMQDPVFRVRKQMEQELAAKRRAEEEDQIRRKIDPEYRARKEREDTDKAAAATRDRRAGLGQLGQKAAGTFASLEQPARAVAGLDPGAALGSANALLAKLGPIGMAAAGATAALAGFTKAVDSAADRLAPYSGALSMAQAQAEINQVMGDMRRAQLLGDDLAQFVMAKSQLSQTAQDTLAQTLRPLIPALTNLIGILESGLAGAREVFAAFMEHPAVQKLTEVVDGLPKWAKAIISPLVALLDIAKKMDSKYEPGTDLGEEIGLTTLDWADRRRAERPLVEGGIRLPGLEGF